MPRKLDNTDLQVAHAWIGEIRSKLTAYAGDDRELLFRMRRKISRVLVNDERGNPADRKRLKEKKWRLQNGRCQFCDQAMPIKGSHLHRHKAIDGYTVENTDLVHAECHHRQQDEVGYV